MTELMLLIGYDEYEEGKRMEQEVERLAKGPDAAALESLIIGDWGQAYENDPSDFMEVLISHKAEFPNLRKLFIGNMSFEDCEVSWINQTNLAPLLEAFPELLSFTAKGSQNLGLDPLRHEKLEELTIICGGLGKDVLEQINASHLPQLQKLELYLGVENYGFDGSLDDVLPLVEPGKFPKLTYLGLKNSELQDEIAIALADAPILDQLDTLDLSLGTLSDKGAEAMLASARIKKLKHLDLSHHYMSDSMIERWKNSGLSVNVDDQQEADGEDDWRSPLLTE